MNYCEIKPYDISNGPGVRVSLFVSGCRNNCPGCFNKEAQDFNYGKPFTDDTYEELKELLDKPHIAGLTILGGEPLDLANVRCVLDIIQRLRHDLPSKSIWVYTGYIIDDNTLHEVITYKHEDVFSYDEKHSVWANYADSIITGINPILQILRLVDVVVDGPFIQDLYNIRLQFRGSSNQRLINMPVTIHCEKLTEWCDGFVDPSDTTKSI